MLILEHLCWYEIQLHFFIINKNIMIITQGFVDNKYVFISKQLTEERGKKDKEGYYPGWTYEQCRVEINKQLGYEYYKK